MDLGIVVDICGLGGECIVMILLDCIGRNVRNFCLCKQVAALVLVTSNGSCAAFVRICFDSLRFCDVHVLLIRGDMYGT